MAPKKSLILLIIALLTMAFITVGCERSYAQMEEGASLATPTLEGAFPEAMPSDMEGVFESGAQTSTALAADAGAAPAAATETPNPDALSPTDDPSAPATLPVIETATNIPPTAAAPGSVPVTYTLKQGEFPYCIARRFNVDPAELLSLNGLTNAQGRIYEAGVVLKMPQSGAAFPSPRALNAHPVSYTLPKNMSVYGVACHFGDVDPTAIISGNTIANTNNIPSGTILNIP